jgi:hypothetical protein
MTSFWPTSEPYLDDGCGSYTDDEDPIEDDDNVFKELDKHEED